MKNEFAYGSILMAEFCIFMNCEDVHLRLRTLKKIVENAYLNFDSETSIRSFLQNNGDIMRWEVTSLTIVELRNRVMLLNPQK